MYVGVYLWFNCVCSVYTIFLPSWIGGDCMEAWVGLLWFFRGLFPILGTKKSGARKRGRKTVRRRTGTRGGRVHLFVGCYGVRPTPERMFKKSFLVLWERQAGRMPYVVLILFVCSICVLWVGCGARRAWRQCRRGLRRWPVRYDALVRRTGEPCIHGRRR